MTTYRVALIGTGRVGYQFNFSDRTYLTVIHPKRDVEIMTVPPSASRRSRAG